MFAAQFDKYAQHNNAIRMEYRVHCLYQGQFGGLV